MTEKLSLAAIAAALCVFPPALVAQIHFTAAMDGTQEVPSIVTSATGTGSLELSGNFSELRYFISYQGMSGGSVAAEICLGKPGVVGSIIKSLSPPASSSGTFSGVWRTNDAQPFTEAFAESLLTGRAYLNLTDSKNPTGEIRGQINLSTSLHFEADYEGSNEVPAVSASGEGTGVFVLNAARTELDYRATYHGLSGPLFSDGEIFTGGPGINGTAVCKIAPSGSPASATFSGSWKISDSQPLTEAFVDSLIAGKLYSNFSTSANPEGELRAQLILQGGIGYLASLDSSQENPPSHTGASATGSFILDENHSGITYRLTFTGFSADMPTGQVHFGWQGLAGQEIKTLSTDGNSAAGTFAGTWTSVDPTEVLTSATVNSLLMEQLYAELGAGSDSSSIRGQLMLTTGIGFTAQLSAKQDVPPTIVSNATGTASVVLSADMQSVAYSLTFLNLSSNISAAGGHFHVGALGQNGQLVKTIVPPNSWGDGSVNGVWQMSDSGSEQLTTPIVDSLVIGDMYINLHTGDYLGGEIRGQVSYYVDLVTSVPGETTSPPVTFQLMQNYPNPFNPSTTIRFTLSQPGFVSLKIFDVLGKLVETLLREEKAAGTYDIRFDASGLSSGVYFFRFQIGGFNAVRKMVFAK